MCLKQHCYSFKVKQHVLGKNVRTNAELNKNVGFVTIELFPLRNSGIYIDNTLSWKTIRKIKKNC